DSNRSFFVDNLIDEFFGESDGDVWLGLRNDWGARQRTTRPSHPAQVGRDLWRRRDRLGRPLLPLSPWPHHRARRDRALFAAARATAENPPRTTARTDASGNVRMSRADREKIDEAKSGAAKAAGASTAAAFLALLSALLGAGLGAAASRGKKLRDSLRHGDGS